MAVVALLIVSAALQRRGTTRRSQTALYLAALVIAVYAVTAYVTSPAAKGNTAREAADAQADTVHGQARLRPVE